MNIDQFRNSFTGQEFDQKISTRLERLRAADSTPVERFALFSEGKDDFNTFIDTFGTIYEPRLAEMPDLPFFMWPYQREAAKKIIEAVRNGEDLLLEKTRDMGITWTVIWVLLWFWLYQPRFYALMGSRKEAEVDDHGPQSLFGKLRYAFYSLPQWMRPEKFKKSLHDNSMKFENPNLDSYIAGESANENFSRGRRFSCIFMDELFFWKFVRESWRATNDATPCRIAVSTPKPSAFARTLRENFKARGRLMSLDMSQHPFKDEEWFKKEVERRAGDALAVSSELDLNYSADPELSYYPEVNGCLIDNELDYKPNLPLFIGLDFGVHDKTAIVYWQRDSKNYFCIDGFEKRNKKLSWYYPFLKKGIDFSDRTEYRVENRFTKEQYIIRKTDYLPDELDLIRRFNQWGLPQMYCGELAHTQKMIQSNTSIAQELGGIGIFLRINYMGIKHLARRTATRKMLESTVFSGKYGAVEVYDALANSSFVKGKNNSGSEDSTDKPVHDETADLRSAVENFAVNIILNVNKVKEVRYR